eukprot:3722324-Alexandrium_andersonii.AAC.1
MIAEMHASGSTKLSLSRAAKLADLEECFPDQCQRIQIFGLTLSTVRELVSLLRYSGPVEYLTMFFCILGARRWR